jgi:hypothetical protein
MKVGATNASATMSSGMAVRRRKTADKPESPGATTIARSRHRQVAGSLVERMKEKGD